MDYYYYVHIIIMCMGLFQQKYWSGLPCPPPGDLSDPWIQSVPLMSPALAAGFFTTNTTWEAQPRNFKLPVA